MKGSQLKSFRNRITNSLMATSIAIWIAVGCGVNGRTTIGPVAKSTTPTVVFIGDSITELWASGPGKAQFVTHPTWVAKGISGQNSTQVLARFQNDVVDLHPGIVHILVGTNDVYPGWALGPCEVPTGSSNVINSAANVTAMVQMALEAKIIVILATIPPWETDPITVGDLAYGADPSIGRYARISTWNSWLREFASANNITLVDYHSALEAPNLENYAADLTLDGVHPSTLGYDVMTPLAEMAIASAPKINRAAERCPGSGIQE